MEATKISIVTVVFNSVNFLEATIQSVLNQTYLNIEYVIIDGGSTDGSLEIIKKYEKSISLWISEPDKGIYDAMNKGINVSNGTWVLFLNAGDIFFDNDVLTLVENEFNDCDVLYGKTAIDNHHGNLIVRDFYSRKLDWKVIPYCHQSVFIKRRYLNSALFNTNYKIGADYNQYFDLKSMNLKFKSINTIISVYDNNGFSNLNYLKLLSEYKKISFINHDSLFDKLKISVYFFLKLILSRF